MIFTCPACSSVIYQPVFLINRQMPDLPAIQDRFQLFSYSLITLSMNRFVSSTTFIRAGSASNHLTVLLIPSLNGMAATNLGTKDLIFELSKMTLTDLSPSRLPHIHPWPSDSATLQIKSDGICTMSAFAPAASA